MDPKALCNSLTIYARVSTMSDIGSPPPLVYLSETEREDSPEVLSPLYHSLVEAIKHPSCVNRAWISTVADMEKNNPRALHVRPYNDGSLHFVDKGGNLLCMAFPAVLVLDGKYGRTGPYFSLATGEQGVKVCHVIMSSYMPFDWMIARKRTWHLCPRPKQCLSLNRSRPNHGMRFR